MDMPKSLPKTTGRSGREPDIVAFYDPAINGYDAHMRSRRDMLNWDDNQLERCHDYIQILFPLPEGSMFSYNAPIIDSKTLEAFREDVALKLCLQDSLGRMARFYGFDMIFEMVGEFPKYDDEDTHDEATSTKGSANGKNFFLPFPASKDSGKNTDDKATSTEVSEPEAGKGKEKASYASGNLAKEESDDDYVDIELAAMKFSEEVLTGLMKLSTRGINKLWDHTTGIRIVRASNFEERSKNWCVPMDHNHLRITRILRSLRVLGLKRHCEAFYVALKKVYNDPAINISERSMMFWTRAVRQPVHIAPDGKECKWLKKWQEDNGVID